MPITIFHLAFRNTTKGIFTIHRMKVVLSDFFADKLHINKPCQDWTAIYSGEVRLEQIIDSRRYHWSTIYGKRLYHLLSRRVESAKGLTYQNLNDSFW